MIKRFFKKLAISVLIVLLLTMLLPFSITQVLAADPISITDGTPRIITGTHNDQFIEISSGVTAYVTLNSVTMNNGAIYIESGATLNLTVSGYNQIYGPKYYAGIEVLSGATLNITAESTGELWAVGGDLAAGIGSGYNSVSTPTSFGTVNIHSGTIHAVGGGDSRGGIMGDFFGGAGIGTGSFANAEEEDECRINCGDITITGGTVTAVGKGAAAGIGGAAYSDLIGTVSISGGYVVAQPGVDWHAAIGPGYFDNYINVFGGTINISGGTVRCTNDSSQTDYETYPLGYESTINISGGSIEASSIDTYLYKIKMRMPLGLRRISVESMTIKVGSLLYPNYGFEDIISTPTNPDYNGYIYLYLDAPSSNLTVDMVGRTTTNDTVNYHYYGVDSSGTLRMDQPALSMAGMHPIYPTSGVISPGTSGGGGTGVVSYSYSGRNGTAYGPSGTAPSSIGDYTITATKAADGTYYAATTAYNFSIIPPLTMADIPDQTYTGSYIEPTVTVKDRGTTLAQGTDYTLSYSNNKDAGTAAEVTVTGINAYEGFGGSRYFTIDPKTTALTVDPIANQTYTGNPLTLVVTVTDGDGLTLDSQDYTITYSNHTDVGTATVQVAGKRNYTNTSTGSRSFTIEPKQSVLKVAAIGSQTYTGSPITPAITVTDEDGLTLDSQDYTVTYSNHTDVGTATVQVAGKRNYTITSTGSQSFTITPKAMILTVDPIASQVYTGGAIEPLPVVKDGSTVLAKDTDYTVSYSANHTDVGAVMVTVTGIGNYLGSNGSQTFDIKPKAATLTVDPIGDQTYTGGAIEPLPVVKDGSTVLVKDTDYTLSYSSNINAGIARITVIGEGNFSGSMGTQTFVINAKVTTFAVDPLPDVTFTGSAFEPAVIAKDGSTTLTEGTDYTVAYSGNINAGTATVSIAGKNNYSGSTGSRFFTIHPCPDFTIEPIANQVYSGSAIEPAVTVKDGYGHAMTADTDYTVSYSDNTAAGTATVSVKGKGNYTGEKSAQFIITKRPVTLLLSTSGSGHAQDDVTLTVYVGNAVDTPQGSVTFKAGEVVIADNVPITLENGSYVAKAVWTAVPEGVYSLTAAYTEAAQDNYSAVQAATLPGYSVTKLDQTGFMGGTVNKTYGSSSFSLSTSGGQSTGAITYAIYSGSSIVSLSGDQVSILKTGQAVITATKLGDARYNPATASIVINIAKAATSIKTLPSATEIIGSGKLSTSRLEGGEGSVPGTFSWKTPNAAISASGKYEVVFTPEDTINYLPCSGKVTVTVKSIISDSDTDDTDSNENDSNVGKTVTDPETGIEVDISDTILPGDVTAISVDVEEVTETGGAVVTTIKDLLSNIDGLGNTDTLAVYDLVLMDQHDVPVSQINGDLAIRIPVPQGMNGKLHVYRYDEAANALVEVESAVENGYVVIKTSQTGYLMIVELADESIPETNDGDGQMVVNEGTEATVSDSAAGAWWIWLIIAAVLGCVSLFAILIIRKKKNERLLREGQDK
jgi:hypothetical protein